MNEIVLSILPYAAGLVATIGTGVWIWLNGKASEQRKQTERDLIAVRQSNENKRAVERMEDDSLSATFDRLYNKKRG